MTNPAPHHSSRALSALSRGEPRDPESYCVHTGAGTHPERCPECEGKGYLLSDHASPTCVEETFCEPCRGSGFTGRHLCNGCDAVIDHVAYVLADPRLAAMLADVMVRAGVMIREKARDASAVVVEGKTVGT